jgi:pilus assembly protein CpaF
MTLEDLVSAGSITEAGGALLLEVVRARLAFLVSGGTGSGKTTLLAALLSYVPAEDRIVIVEDASELRPRHPHVVSMEARQANVEGAGAVPLRELVRQALRMRPDRLVVGEVRGAEVVDLLAALNTGHEGGCGTLHANTAADVPARLEALGVAAGLPRDAVHAQLASALHAVLHVRRHPDGVRRLDEVGVVCRDERGYVRVSTAVSCPADREPVRGPAADELEGLLTSRSGR